MHLISRIVGKIANSKIKWLKNFLINLAVKFYKIDLRDAVERNPNKYPSFNAFFTRALLPQARPIVSDVNAVACPVDGKISQIGEVSNATIIQAKGFTFSVNSLLSIELQKYSAKFANGMFATIYLSPRDYHRIHLPFDGDLIAMAHIPGKLFSVNPKIVNKTSSLYARNERVVLVFNTKLGLMAMVLVGAALVASITTVWAGEITPPTRKKIRTWNYKNNKISFKRGEEIGHFQFGSTVILLFEGNMVRWEPKLAAEHALKMGQKIGFKI